MVKSGRILRGSAAILIAYLITSLIGSFIVNIILNLFASDGFSSIYQVLSWWVQMIPLFMTLSFIPFAVLRGILQIAKKSNAVGFAMAGALTGLPFLIFPLPDASNLIIRLLLLGAAAVIGAFLGLIYGRMEQVLIRRFLFAAE